MKKDERGISRYHLFLQQTLICCLSRFRIILFYAFLVLKDSLPSGIFPFRCSVPFGRKRKKIWFSDTEASDVRRVRLFLMLLGKRIDIQPVAQGRFRWYKCLFPSGSEGSSGGYSFRPSCASHQPAALCRKGIISTFLHHSFWVMKFCDLLKEALV